jgi:deoxycytidylate deaminase
MSRQKLLQLLVAIISALYLSAIPLSSQAATKAKQKTTQKERLVLMPLRIPEEDKNLAGAMETAIVKGLQQKYDVFAGEQVSQKAHQIFLKESRNTAHTECDETRCMQNIAEAFQAELIATANVAKQDGNYFLAMSIQNIFDNNVVYSESLPCEGCNVSQVIEKLKELSVSQNAALMTDLTKHTISANLSSDVYFHCIGNITSKVINSTKYNDYTNQNEEILAHITDGKITFSGNKYLSGQNIKICTPFDDEFKFDTEPCKYKSSAIGKDRKNGTFNKITGELLLTNELGKYYGGEGTAIEEGRFKCSKVQPAMPASNAESVQSLGR